MSAWLPLRGDEGDPRLEPELLSGVMKHVASSFRSGDLPSVRVVDQERVSRLRNQPNQPTATRNRAKLRHKLSAKSAVRARRYDHEGALRIVPVAQQ